MFFRKFLVMFLFHQCAQSSSKEYCFAALLYKKEKLQYTLQSVANKEKKIHLILQMKLMFCYLYGLQRMPFYIKEGLISKTPPPPPNHPRCAEHEGNTSKIGCRI